MHFKSIYLQIKHLIFLFLYFFPIFLIGQNQNNFISNVYDEQDLNAEIISLEAKRENLLSRKYQLIIDPYENTDQINRIEEMVSYIDYKLIKLHFQLKIEEEYIKKKHEWDILNPELKNELKQDQLILRKYEFDRLTKERQAKILSMPERYVIIEQ